MLAEILTGGWPSSPQSRFHLRNRCGDAEIEGVRHRGSPQYLRSLFSLVDGWLVRRLRRCGDVSAALGKEMPPPLVSTLIVSPTRVRLSPGADRPRRGGHLPPEPAGTWGIWCASVGRVTVASLGMSR